MLLIKLFTGYEPLQYMAIIMIVYASVKVIFENNMLSILCYLSIMAMGLMLLGISYGSDAVILATISYLFIHIIYKSLLIISVVSLIDQTGVYDCCNLKKINSNIILAGLIIGITMMINIPAISSFYVKSSILHAFAGTPTYFIIIFLSFMIVLVLPWKQYFTANESFDIKLNTPTKLSLLFISIALAIVGIAGEYLPILSRIETFQEISLASADSLKQTIIILTALTLAMLWKSKRKITKPMNSTDTIGDLLFYAYAIWLKKQPQKEHDSEPMGIESLERQTTLKLALIHNQQTAIFVVFIIFIILLMVLTTSV